MRTNDPWEKEEDAFAAVEGESGSEEQEAAKPNAAALKAWEAKFHCANEPKIEWEYPAKLRHRVAKLKNVNDPSKYRAFISDAERCLGSPAKFSKATIEECQEKCNKDIKCNYYSFAKAACESGAKCCIDSKKQAMACSNELASGLKPWGWPMPGACWHYTDCKDVVKDTTPGAIKYLKTKRKKCPGEPTPTTTTTPAWGHGAAFQKGPRGFWTGLQPYGAWVPGQFPCPKDPKNPCGKFGKDEHASRPVGGDCKTAADKKKGKTIQTGFTPNHKVGDETKRNTEFIRQDWPDADAAAIGLNGALDSKTTTPPPTTYTMTWHDQDDKTGNPKSSTTKWTAIRDAAKCGGSFFGAATKKLFPGKREDEICDEVFGHKFLVCKKGFFVGMGGVKMENRCIKDPTTTTTTTSTQWPGFKPIKPGKDDGQSFMVEGDFWLIGSELKNIGFSDMVRDLCTSTTGCNSFTYCAKKKNAFLFRDRFTTSTKTADGSKDGCTTYYRANVDPTPNIRYVPLSGGQLQPKDNINKKVSGVELGYAMDACEQDNNCQAFKFCWSGSTMGSKGSYEMSKSKPGGTAKWSLPRSGCVVFGRKPEKAKCGCTNGHGANAPACPSAGFRDVCWDGNGPISSVGTETGPNGATSGL